jgi:hypothetical protein
MSAGQSISVLLGALGIITTAVVFYVIPGLVATARHKRDAGAIWLLNILAGWTFIGWVGALIWAMTHDQEVGQ